MHITFTFVTVWLYLCIWHVCYYSTLTTDQFLNHYLQSIYVQNQMPIDTYSNSTILIVQLSDGGALICQGGRGLPGLPRGAATDTNSIAKVVLVLFSVVSMSVSGCVCLCNYSWTVWDIVMKFLWEQDTVKSSDVLPTKQLYSGLGLGLYSVSMWRTETPHVYWQSIAPRPRPIFCQYVTYRNSTCLLAVHSAHRVWLQVRGRSATGCTCRVAGVHNSSTRSRSPLYHCVPSAAQGIQHSCRVFPLKALKTGWGGGPSQGLWV